MSKRKNGYKNDQESVAVLSADECLMESDQVIREEIAELAYRRWLTRGCPPGSAEEDWLEAERELLSHRIVSKSA